MSPQWLTAIVAGLTLIGTIANAFISLQTKNEVLQAELRTREWAEDRFVVRPDAPPARRRQTA